MKIPSHAASDLFMGHYVLPIFYKHKLFTAFATEILLYAQMTLCRLLSAGGMEDLCSTNKTGCNVKRFVCNSMIN